MIKQKWNISEDERKRILNLHESATKNQYLLKEETDPNKKSFNISKSFPSGQFNIVDTSDIDNAINEIQELLKTGQGKFDTIIINSSESKVPNRGVGLQTGELSKKRAEEVQKYITSKLGDSVNIKVNDLGPQGPEWDSSKGSNNPEYTKYQYVTLSLGAEKSQTDTNTNIKSICDFTIDESGGQGREEDNYVTLNEPLKDYGELTIDTGSIPDRMVVVNKENSIVSDTGYVATKPHQYRKFKYVPLYVYQLTLLHKINKSSSVSGDKLETITVSSFEGLIRNLLVKSLSIPRNEELRKMGSEVTKGIKGLENLFNRGVRTFVVYSIGGIEIGKVPFDSRKGDSKVIVYSPVGRTGYTITGNCPNQE